MKSRTASGFRVFISYSHDDRSIFEAVCAALQSAGVEPWSDVDLTAGTGFTEQIQTNISHSHVFVPILTPRSHARGWVHQEVGYAVAMKIPCVPICVGKLPDGMIAMAHAVVVDDALAGLGSKLSAIDFNDLVEQAGSSWLPPGETALEPEDRAQTIVRQADAARHALGPSCVRIQGGLSSFSIPDEPPEHPVWLARYGDRPRAPYSCELFRRERRALARHAAVGGVRMIINHGPDLDAQYGVGTKRTRLCLLIRFLESLDLPGEHVQIVLVPEQRLHLILAVGDWFVAESLAGRPVRGVLQTVFTSHAPTVNRRIAEFDDKFAKLLVEQGTLPEQSKAWAVDRLLAMVRQLPPHPAWRCDC